MSVAKVHPMMRPAPPSVKAGPLKLPGGYDLTLPAVRPPTR
jgi:hypothetical protein